MNINLVIYLLATRLMTVYVYVTKSLEFHVSAIKSVREMNVEHFYPLFLHKKRFYINKFIKFQQVHSIKSFQKYIKLINSIFPVDVDINYSYENYILVQNLMSLI